MRCGDSPGFIGPRLQVLLMNEAVRLVEEGVATPEDVDRAFRAGMGFRYASIGIFEFIDWGGVDILYRASRYMTEALGDERFRPARLVEEKMARNELGPKTGRGFFDYTGERREAFETEKVRALLRRLKRERERPREQRDATSAPIDPFPLETADHNKLHEFYARLGHGPAGDHALRGVRHDAPGRRAASAASAPATRFEWVDLPARGHRARVHGAGHGAARRLRRAARVRDREGGRPSHLHDPARTPIPPP